MYYPDLAQECQVDRGSYVRAIGWLSIEHPFPTGSVPLEFLEALRQHLDRPWQPVAAAGRHQCEFCASGTRGASGSANCWIPAGDVVYVIPELVLHYIEAHAYQPPEDFIAAVLASPEQCSPLYREHMRRLPGWWVEWLD